MRLEGRGPASVRRSLGLAMEAAWRRGAGRVLPAGPEAVRGGAGSGPEAVRRQADRPLPSLPLTGPQSRRAMAAAGASRCVTGRSALAASALASAPAQDAAKAGWPRPASVVGTARPSSRAGKRALRCLEAVSAGPGGDMQLQAALDRLARPSSGSPVGESIRVKELSFRARLACKWLVTLHALQRGDLPEAPPAGATTVDARSAPDDSIMAELQAAHARLTAQLSRAGIMPQVRAWASAPRAAASASLPW